MIILRIKISRTKLQDQTVGLQQQSTVGGANGSAGSSVNVFSGSSTLGGTTGGSGTVPGDTTNGSNTSAGQSRLIKNQVENQSPQFEQMFSNILKQDAATQSGIIGNLKGD